MIIITWKSWIRAPVDSYKKQNESRNLRKSYYPWIKHTFLIHYSVINSSWYILLWLVYFSFFDRLLFECISPITLDSINGSCVIFFNSYGNTDILAFLQAFEWRHSRTHCKVSTSSYLSCLNLVAFSLYVQELILCTFVDVESFEVIPLMDIVLYWNWDT